MLSKVAVLFFALLLLHDLVPVSPRGRGGGGVGGGGGRGGGRGGRLGPRGKHHRGRLAGAGTVYFGVGRHLGPPDGNDGDGRSGRKVRQTENFDNSEQKTDTVGGLTNVGFRALIICLIVGIMVVVAAVIVCRFCCRNYNRKKEKASVDSTDAVFIVMDDDDIKKPLPCDDESETNEKSMLLLNKSYDSMPPLEPEYEDYECPPKSLATADGNQDSPPPPYEVQSDQSNDSTPSPDGENDSCDRHSNRDLATVPLVGAMAAVPLGNIQEDIDGEMRHARNGNGYLTPVSNTSRQTSPSRSIASDQSVETSDETLPRLSESDNSVDVHFSVPVDNDDEDNDMNENDHKNDDDGLQHDTVDTEVVANAAKSQSPAEQDVNLEDPHEALNPVESENCVPHAHGPVVTNKQNEEETVHASPSAPLLAEPPNEADVSHQHSDDLRSEFDDLRTEDSIDTHCRQDPDPNENHETNLQESSQAEDAIESLDGLPETPEDSPVVSLSETASESQSKDHTNDKTDNIGEGVEAPDHKPEINEAGMTPDDSDKPDLPVVDESKPMCSITPTKTGELEVKSETNNEGKKTNTQEKIDGDIQPKGQQDPQGSKLGPNADDDKKVDDKMDDDDDEANVDNKNSNEATIEKTKDSSDTELAKKS